MKWKPIQRIYLMSNVIHALLFPDVLAITAPVVNSPLLWERNWGLGVCSEKGNKAGEGPGALVLWEEAERTGIV